MTRIAIIVTMLVTFPSLLFAYSIHHTPAGYIQRWKKLPITYYVNPAGSDNISNGSDIASIEKAFKDWEKIGCSKLLFEKLGNTNVTKVTGVGADSNGKNELVWVEGSAWTLGKYVLAVTVPVVKFDGTIVEADIAFNGYKNKWSSGVKFGQSHVLSVAIHEIGHMFGLQHNLGGWPANDPPTMAPTVDPYGKSSSLEPDDQLGACFLYPSGEKFLCDKESDCPYIVQKDSNSGKESYSGKLICKGSICQFDAAAQGGNTQFGEICQEDNECVKPYFCQLVKEGGPSYCSYYCNPLEDLCPNGFACFAYAGKTDEGACMPKNVGGGEPNGASCSHSLDCKSANCYPVASGQWECWDKCSGDADCGTTAKCFHAPGFVFGACLPASMFPSDKIMDGDPCNLDDECESGICLPDPGKQSPTFCRSTCNPGVDSCGFGFECVSSAGGGACLPAVIGAIGEACSTDTDCASALCFGGSCEVPCDLANSSCSGQEGCRRLGEDSADGVCWSEGALAPGAVCNSDTECSTLFCATGNDGARLCHYVCVLSVGGCGEAVACDQLPGLEVLGMCGSEPVNQPSTEGGSDGGTVGGSGSGPPHTATTTTGGCSGGSGAPVQPTAWILLIGLLLLLPRNRAQRDA